jgi:nitrogen fixation/metabolism regulation signal transduction histidine kinase
VAPSSTAAADPARRLPRPTSSVRVRIGAAFLAVVTVHLGVVLFLLLQLREVTRAQALVTEGYLPLSLQIDQLGGDQERIERDLARLRNEERRPGTGDRAPAAVFAERLRETLLEARVYARRTSQLAQDPAEVAVVHRTQAQLAGIEELVKRYQTDTQSLLRVQGDTRPSDEAFDRAVETGRALAEEVDRLSSVLDARVRALNDSAHEAADRARTLAVAMTAATLALAAAAVLAAWYWLRPIGTLTTHVQRLAAGERPARLDVRGADEISMLAAEFDRMVDAVEQRDQTLRERADELSRLSRYLGNVLDTLAGALLVVEAGTVTLANPAAGRLFGVRVGGPVPEVLRPWATGDAAGDRLLALADATEHEVRAVPFGDGGVIVWSLDVTEQRRAADRLASSERLALDRADARPDHPRGPQPAQRPVVERRAARRRARRGSIPPSGAPRPGRCSETVIAREVDRLTQVTGHYLQLARRPSGAPRARADLRRAAAPRSRASSRPELDAPLASPSTLDRARAPAGQLVDANQLRQALLNLVRNAVEAGGPPPDAGRCGLDAGPTTC